PQAAIRRGRVRAHRPSPPGEGILDAGTAGRSAPHPAPPLPGLEWRSFPGRALRPDRDPAGLGDVRTAGGVPEGPGGLRPRGIIPAPGTDLPGEEVPYGAAVPRDHPTAEQGSRAVPALPDLLRHRRSDPRHALRLLVLRSRRPQPRLSTVQNPVTFSPVPVLHRSA